MSSRPNRPVVFRKCRGCGKLFNVDRHRFYCPMCQDYKKRKPILKNTLKPFPMKPYEVVFHNCRRCGKLFYATKRYRLCTKCVEKEGYHDSYMKDFYGEKLYGEGTIHKSEESQTPEGEK